MKYLFSIFLMAHIMGDFVLQTNKIAKLKSESLKGLLIHIAVYGVLQIIVLSLFFGMVGLVAAVLLTATHLVIDGVKLKVSERLVGIQTFYYILDQILHMLMIVAFISVSRATLKTHIMVESLTYVINSGLISYYALTILAKFLFMDLEITDESAPFFQPNERLVDGIYALLVYATYLLGSVHLLWVVPLTGIFYPIQRQVLNYDMRAITLKICVYISMTGIIFYTFGV